MTFQVFVAELDGRLIAMQGFSDLESARTAFHDGLLRSIVRSWNSPAGEIAARGTLVIREATAEESSQWRAGRAVTIKSGKLGIDPDLNPMLFPDEPF